MIDTLSSGERKGQSPNRCVHGHGGVVGPLMKDTTGSGTVVETWSVEGDTPVRVTCGV